MSTIYVLLHVLLTHSPYATFLDYSRGEARGEGEGMADAVGVHLGADLLGDAVDDVVLDVLGDAGDEGDADGGAEEERDTAEELFGGVELVLGGVVVDDVAEDEGVEEGEDLVDGGEQERQENKGDVVLQVAVQDGHRIFL